MTFPIYGNIKMFQSTKQIHMSIVFCLVLLIQLPSPSFVRSMVTMVTMVLEDLIGSFWWSRRIKYDNWQTQNHCCVSYMGSEVGYWWLPNGDWLPSARQTKKTQIWRLGFQDMWEPLHELLQKSRWWGQAIPDVAYLRVHMNAAATPHPIPDGKHLWCKTCAILGPYKNPSGQMIYIIWDGPLFIWKSKLEALRTTNNVHVEC